MIAAHEKRKRGSSRIVWILTALVVAFVAWAQNAPLDEIVRGQGVLIPSSNAQVVQSLEGGILDEINVSEGDRVEEGQVLARLNETRFRAEVTDFEGQIRTITARILRLQTELNRGTAFELPDEIVEADPELARSELQLFQARLLQFNSDLAAVDEQLALETEKVELMTSLVSQNALPEIDLINQRVTLGDVKADRERILSEFELSRAEEMSDLVSELARLRAQVAHSRDQLERSQLVAPADGIINTIYTTTIGGVVQSGEPIFEITPLNDELLVEVRIQPKDIALISTDQRTTVKLSAYDYTIYGSLQGRIVQISADTFEDDTVADGQTYYKVLVAVDEYFFPRKDEDVDVRPGMLADVEVHVGERTVMQYLIKPLAKTTNALREP